MVPTLAWKGSPMLRVEARNVPQQALWKLDQQVTQSYRLLFRPSSRYNHVAAAQTYMEGWLTIITEDYSDNVLVFDCAL